MEVVVELKFVEVKGVLVEVVEEVYMEVVRGRYDVNMDLSILLLKCKYWS